MSCMPVGQGCTGLQADEPYVWRAGLQVAGYCIAHGCRLMSRMPGGQGCTGLQADEPYAWRAGLHMVAG